MIRRAWMVVVAVFAFACERTPDAEKPNLGAIKQEAFVSAASTTDAPVLTSAPSTQTAPSVAFNGNTYLVVWEDYRNPATSPDIWGAFVTGAQVSPAKGFVISNANAAQRSPKVASDGANFFVIWTDTSTAGQAENIFGTQVTSAGVVTTPNGFAIRATGAAEKDPAVTAITTGEYAVAWSVLASAGNQDVWLRRVKADGSASPSAFAVASTAGNELWPAIALWSTDTVGVAWTAQSTPGYVVNFRRVNVGSGTEDPSPTALSTQDVTAGHVALAAGGTNTGVAVWTRQYQETLTSGAIPTQSELVAARISGATLLGRHLIEKRTGAASGPTQINHHRPAVAFDGALYRILAAFGDPGFESTNVFLRRSPSGSLVHGTISPSGAVSPTTYVPVTTESLQTIVATNGFPGALSAIAGNARYAWSVNIVGDGQDVYLTTQNAVPTGELSGVRVTRADNEQISPAVGFDGTQFLLAWTDNRTPANLRDIYALRLSTAGAKIDPQPFEVSNSALGEGSPRVAGGDGGFLVQFEATASSVEAYVRYSHVDADGGVTVTGASPHSLTAGRRTSINPSWDGTNFVVAFGTPYDVRLARVDGAGVTLDVGGVFVADAGNTPSYAYVVSAGDRTLATYVDYNTGDIRSALVATSPSVSVLENLGGNDGGADDNTIAATDGVDFLRVWTDKQRGQHVAQLIRADGGLGALQIVAPVVSSQARRAAVAFDGRYYAVLYESSADAGVVPDELRARWFDSAGAPLPGASFLVHAGEASQFRLPSLAGDGRGHLLVAYSEFTPSTQTNRVFHRLLRYHRDPGEACGAGTECPSGSCVDGFCCDTTCGGGASNDCQVCSVALGASANGTCTFLPNTTQCRAASTDAADVCDAPELCSGTSGDCPADVAAAQGTSCRDTQGRACDAEEVCDGQSKQCPADAVLPSTATCRAAQGVCDVEEKCDGASASCPVDALRGASDQCEAPTSCTEATFCSGSSATCPPLVSKPEGTPCPDAVDGVCRGGQCVSASRVSRYALISCSSSSGGAALLALIFVGAAFFRRRRAAVVAVLVLLAATSAQAADKVKLTFLGLTPGTGVSAEELESVSSFVQSQIASLDVYQVIGAAEVRALIGAERQRQLLGCGENTESCMQELAGALDADRAVAGDVAVVSGNTVLNLSLLDPRTSKVIKRVGRRVDGDKAFDAIFDVAPGAVVELVSADPAIDPKAMKIERGFGGIVAGLRADSDVAGRGIAPGITAEISSRRFGGALAVFYGQAPGVRAEGRFYPVTLGIVRPYVGLGATVFAPDVAARGSLGVAVALGSFQLFGDGAYERSLTPDATGAGARLYRKDAVLLGVGAGWAF